MNIRQRTKFAKALFEVLYPDDDHNDVHKRDVGDDRKDEQHDLLRQFQLFHVNRVKAGLG